MKPGLKISVIYFDDDLLELQVQAANQLFSGETHLYCHHSAPKEMADLIRGFPAEIGDSRTCELGTFDPEYAGGGVKVRLSCTDGTGHSLAHITLKYLEVEKMRGNVSLNFPIEPAAVDRFVTQLESLRAELRKTAELRGLA